MLYNALRKDLFSYQISVTEYNSELLINSALCVEFAILSAID